MCVLYIYDLDCSHSSPIKPTFGPDGNRIVRDYKEQPVGMVKINRKLPCAVPFQLVASSWWESGDILKAISSPKVVETPSKKLRLLVTQLALTQNCTVAKLLQFTCPEYYIHIPPACKQYY